jgi:hypothetical protein
MYKGVQLPHLGLPDCPSIQILPALFARPLHSPFQDYFTESQPWGFFGLRSPVSDQPLTSVGRPALLFSKIRQPCLPLMQASADICIFRSIGKPEGTEGDHLRWHTIDLVDSLCSLGSASLEYTIPRRVSHLHAMKCYQWTLTLSHSLSHPAAEAVEACAAITFCRNTAIAHLYQQMSKTP